ncbi:MAG TPA: CheR family methyltransferase [Burkholderiales bacterium]|nr:CheR family methyltransferase [Burkholderiales bacterium]
MATRSGLNTGAPPAGEYELSDADFERVRELIHRHAGISLSPAKRQMVYSRLIRRLRTLGLQDFGEYLGLLETDDNGERQAFTNALTTNLTAFFREPHHFPILVEHARRLNRRPLKIWSSACSTGEEPYSIAMAMAEAFGVDRDAVRILASDVDTSVLEKARFGAYPTERIGKVPEDQVRKFFLRGTGGREGMVKARPELRDMITFRQINLLEPNWGVRGPLDAIFCRNVMIYFDRKTQYELLSRFAAVLAPDGLLFAGHSESLQHAADLFSLRGKTVYRLAGAKAGSVDD